MNAMTHTGNFGFSFAEAVDTADLDAEIAAYKAEQAAEAARPDFIVYCPVRGGFVYGSESGVYASNTAADIARSAPPTPSPMPGLGDFDESDSGFCVTCNCPAGGFFHDMLATTWVDLRHAFVAVAPIPTPTPMPGPGDFDEGDSTLCANCGGPAHEWCDECDLDVCVTCSPRFHRHGQPAGSRRNGAVFFDRQRVAAAFRTSTIETYLLGARAAAAELHGEVGDVAYSEHVQCGVDELFN